MDRNQGRTAGGDSDRWLLNQGSHQTWDVHDGVVDRSEGGYAAYIWQPTPETSAHSGELPMAKIAALKREIRTKMATCDQSDYKAITTMTRELCALAEQNASLNDTGLTLNDPLAGQRNRLREKLAW